MSKIDTTKVLEHLGKAREAAAPDPSLVQKIKTAEQHVTERIDPKKGG